MAFRLIPILTVFFDNLGVPLAGGVLEFLETDDTTPKNVYSDQGLTVNLGSTVTLDSAGRVPSDVWGSGTYRIRMTTFSGTLVDEADPVYEQGNSGDEIPSQSGHAGEVLTTNGATLAWASSRTVPDPTGNADKLLTNDGSVLLWKTLTELGLPDVTTGTGRGEWVIGDYRVAFGNDTLPIPSVTPPHGAVKAITFTTAFAATPVCYGAWGNKNSIATHDYKPVVSCEANTTTLTAQYNINENSTDATADVAVAVPFSWFAIGLA